MSIERDPESQRLHELAEEAKAWGPGTARPGSYEPDPDAAPRAKESESISIRLPVRMLRVLKAVAKRRGIGYQVLIKLWLDDKIREVCSAETLRRGESPLETSARFRSQVEVVSGPPIRFPAASPLILSRADSMHFDR